MFLVFALSNAASGAEAMLPRRGADDTRDGALGVARTTALLLIRPKRRRVCLDQRVRIAGPAVEV